MTELLASTGLDFTPSHDATTFLRSLGSESPDTNSKLRRWDANQSPDSNSKLRRWDANPRRLSNELEYANHSRWAGGLEDANVCTKAGEDSQTLLDWENDSSQEPSMMEHVNPSQSIEDVSSNRSVENVNSTRTVNTSQPQQRRADAISSLLVNAAQSQRKRVDGVSDANSSQQSNMLDHARKLRNNPADVQLSNEREVSKQKLYRWEDGNLCSEYGLNDGDLNTVIPKKRRLPPLNL